MSEEEAVADPEPDTEEVTDAADGAAGDAEEAVDGDDTKEVVDAETEAAIADRIADADPADIAIEIAALRERAVELEVELEDTEAEREELESRLKRKQAEFQNYKKRQSRRREQERKRATEELITRLLDVRDNLSRALDTDEDSDIREGVEATRRQLDDVLDAEGVERIVPEVGEEIDPQRHEVLLGVESDHPEGTVVDLKRPGYLLGEKVLRPAQVTASNGDSDE